MSAEVATLLCEAGTLILLLNKHLAIQEHFEVIVIQLSNTIWKSKVCHVRRSLVNMYSAICSNICGYILHAS